MYTSTEIGEQMSQAQLRDSAYGFNIGNFNLSHPPKDYPHCRQTVAVLLISERNRLYLVQSIKDNTRQTWGIPQGGIKSGETFLDALARESQEELGVVLTQQELKHATALGTFMNILPDERKKKKREIGEDCRDKLLYFTAVNIDRYPCIELKKDEVNDFAKVDNWNSLWSIMAMVEKDRWQKCHAVWSAVEIAIDLNLLAWPKRPDYMSIER